MIEQDKQLPEPAIQKFGRDLAQGLYYLHANSVVYCDLKPSNVLLNEYSTLKLCDFGLARKLVDLQADGKNQEAGGEDANNPKRKNGTPYYMAPELFTEEGVFSFQSDIWALGCVLYEMATGEPPFGAKGLNQLISQIQEAPTPNVEKFSPIFNDLLGRLLQKDPVKRISWEHLRKHPFWTKEVNVRKLPRQPTFDNYLKKSRGINPDEFADQQAKEGYFIPNLAHFVQPRRADPLRVSQKVKKNMLKNAKSDYEVTPGADDATDIRLNNKDQELIFEGEDNEPQDGANKNETDDADVPSEPTSAGDI